jgi:DNA-binding winged helix-turn-helix (wHTH) protein/predicted Zn-dependent protease
LNYQVPEIHVLASGCEFEVEAEDRDRLPSRTMDSFAHRGLVYHFGVFEVLAESRELLRHGHRVKLQEQPFQLLLLLLENPGEIVSREVLQQRLWPGNTFVEFGQSLGTAITKLRQALGDDSDNPRFVETVPRRGYRFIAPVDRRDTFDANLLKPSSRSREVVDESQKAPVNISSVSSSSKGRPVIWFALFAAGLIVFFVAYSIHRRNAFALSPKDTIVLADFENTTEEPVFNDSLRQGLMVGLAQSPVIHILSDRNSAVIFRQMGHASDTRMTGQAAVALCRRVGGKAEVQGSISSLGTSYLVALAAIRCDTGKPIAREEVEAPQREDVVGALGRATAQLRARLGESLPSIRKYNAPLEQATTSSLEALNAYGEALSTWDAKGDMASLPLFKKAIELDPNFAMAYGGLATVYNNLGETALATENVTNAYKLRDRVTEAERGSIDARYYLYVTGEVDKAALTYQALAQDYPDSAGSLNHLGTTDMKLGRNEQAVESFRRAILLDGTRATTYGNLAVSLLRANQMQEAISVLEQAEKRNLHTDYLLQVNYWVAFLKEDQEKMAHILQQSSQVPGAGALLLSEQADTESYHGHFEAAGELSKAAADQMKHDGDKESAATCLAHAAVREAQVGYSGSARSVMEEADKITDDKTIATLSALVAALTGDSKRAATMVERLDDQHPHDTFLQRYWLPIIRAEIELGQGRAEKAIILMAQTEPFDFAVADEFTTSSLYPVYVRGQAYLAAGNGDKAAAEFEKMITHPGMVLNLPLGSLAYLGRGRALSLAGRSSEAADAYRSFFRLWKGADSNVPILRQAHEEFDRLKADSQ